VGVGEFESGAGAAVLIRVVEIGANGQSCDPSITLLFKLVLGVVLEVGDSRHAGKLMP